MLIVTVYMKIGKEKRKEEKKKTRKTLNDLFCPLLSFPDSWQNFQLVETISQQRHDMEKIEGRTAYQREQGSVEQGLKDVFYSI